MRLRYGEQIPDELTDPISAVVVTMDGTARVGTSTGAIACVSCAWNCQVRITVVSGGVSIGETSGTTAAFLIFVKHECA